MIEQNHDFGTSATVVLKRVAFDVIQDSSFGLGVIHCGLKENRDGQGASDGVA
jgi:hypothetical protein